MKRLKIRYMCRSCKKLNQLSWRNIKPIKNKPHKCNYCHKLNHIVSRKISYFSHINFLPTKYFQFYKNAVKEIKKEEGKIIKKLDKLFFKISSLTFNQEEIPLTI